MRGEKVERGWRGWREWVGEERELRVTKVRRYFFW